MKKLILGLTIVIALLNIAAGVAKVMQTPQEVEFLTSQGLSLNMILAFGIIQILGGVLLLVPKTKFIGAVISLIAFAASAVLIFKSGDLTFGLISIVPVAILIYILFQNIKKYK